MSEARHRKLSSMGMAALVSTARPDVLSRIPGDIFNMWTDVLLELKEAQGAVSNAAEDGEYGVVLVDFQVAQPPPVPQDVPQCTIQILRYGFVLFQFYRRKTQASHIRRDFAFSFGMYVRNTLHLVMFIPTNLRTI